LPILTQNYRLSTQPRQHKTASFLSAHPVFPRAEFAAAFGHPASAANVTSLLRHHLRAGQSCQSCRVAEKGAQAIEKIESRAKSGN
jgi:hypothetical protein